MSSDDNELAEESDDNSEQSADLAEFNEPSEDELAEHEINNDGEPDEEAFV